MHICAALALSMCKGGLFEYLLADPMKSFYFPLFVLISTLVVGCASSQQPTPAQQWLDQREQRESDDIQLDRIP